MTYQAKFQHLSLPVATWHITDSTYFLTEFSLVFPPSSILPYHRSKQLLYSLNNKSNTYVERLPTSVKHLSITREVLDSVHSTLIRQM